MAITITIITAIIAILITIVIAMHEMRQISLLSGQQQKEMKQANKQRGMSYRTDNAFDAGLLCHDGRGDEIRNPHSSHILHYSFQHL
jgi:hypothetical protein